MLPSLCVLLYSIANQGDICNPFLSLNMYVSMLYEALIIFCRECYYKLLYLHFILHIAIDSFRCLLEQYEYHHWLLCCGIDTPDKLIHGWVITSCDDNFRLMQSHSDALNSDLVIHFHHSDVKMGAMASQITSLRIVYLNLYSGADQRKD